jgi:hypothetical protein
VPSTVRRKAKGDKRVTEGESRNKGGGGKFGGKKFGKNKKKKR